MGCWIGQFSRPKIDLVVGLDKQQPHLAVGKIVTAVIKNTGESCDALLLASEANFVESYSDAQPTLCRFLLAFFF